MPRGKVQLVTNGKHAFSSMQMSWALEKRGGEKGGVFLTNDCPKKQIRSVTAHLRSIFLSKYISSLCWCNMDSATQSCLLISFDSRSCYLMQCGWLLLRSLCNYFCTIVHSFSSSTFSIKTNALLYSIARISMGLCSIFYTSIQNGEKIMPMYISPNLSRRNSSPNIFSLLISDLGCCLTP